ncbi:MAG: 2-amino-4-ketopentanoate thiolase [Clostridiales bacterium]|nr:2-amino-4-ketopentanoate thiolase [Clostridiales bacterium]
MTRDRCEVDQWVEIERVLLEPSDRAGNLPDDTAAQPLRVWVRGFARDEVSLGEECEVETVTGRVVAGVLTAVNPGYTHTFGTPPPGIAGIGRDLRARVAAYRADDSEATAHRPGE